MLNLTKRSQNFFRTDFITPCSNMRNFVPRMLPTYQCLICTGNHLCRMRTSSDNIGSKVPHPLIATGLEAIQLMVDLFQERCNPFILKVELVCPTRSNGNSIRSAITLSMCPIFSRPLRIPYRIRGSLTCSIRIPLRHTCS